MPSNPPNRVTRMDQQPRRRLWWKCQRPKHHIQMTCRLLRNSTRSRMRSLRSASLTLFLGSGVGAEGVQCVRRDVCVYKVRNLVGLEMPPVEEVKVAPGPGSWNVVEDEVEGATCILLLQLFRVTTPVRHASPHQQKEGT